MDITIDMLSICHQYVVRMDFATATVESVTINVYINGNDIELVAICFVVLPL